MSSRIVQPLLRMTVDLADVEAIAALGQTVTELRDRVKVEGLKVGIALHRWLTATEVELVLYPGTPAAKPEAERLLREGFDVGFPEFEDPEDATPSDAGADSDQG